VFRVVHRQRDFSSQKDLFQREGNFVEEKTPCDVVRWVTGECMTHLGKKIIVAWSLFFASVFAATPVIMVDFNQYGRGDAEVNESGYTSWPVATSSSSSMTISGVTVTVAQNGSVGTGLTSTWYKAGIQSPYYARLVCDGLTVQDGNAGGSVAMTLDGLPAGTHTMLTYLNTVDGNVYADVAITVDGTTVVKSVVPSNRATSTNSSAYAYFSFTATAGKTVKIVFTPNSASSSAYKNIVLNGFALNVPNTAKQASSPYPADNDYHADADAGSIKLSWNAANGAVSHDLYFGTDSTTVATSTQALYSKISATAETVTGMTVLNNYFWRVDERDANGVVTPGAVWQFAPRHLAFPGAEGYGRFARGGRGGKVVHVSSLADAGVGTLREAVENDIGPRTIVFDVSGIIILQSRLTLASNNITIAGQTAPGKGICIRSAPFGFSGVSDGIMRFMRIRLGGGQTYDGTGLQGSDHCIFDHNSVSWTIDESFSSRSGKNITLQRTMLAEALNVAGHQNYPAGTAHGYAASISGDIGSFHHNLLADNDGRNWSLAGGLDANGYYSGRLDIFNNVVYNWNDRPTDGGAHEVNFVANYYKPGAATTLKLALNAQFDGFPGTQQYFCSGNIVKGVYDNPSAAHNGCVSDTANHDPWVNAAFFPSYATVQNVTDAYKDVLSDVGATLPIFDDHDQRMIKETWTGTYTYKGSVSGLPGLPDNEADVGGYESYPALTRAANFDSDDDGMPDWWESLHGLSTNSAAGDFSESNADPDGDGYTNLEDYLQWMATPHYDLDVSTPIQINLASYSRGYQTKPTYTITSNTCATSSITDSILTVTAKSTCGIFTLDFTAKDNAGSSKVRTLGFHVNGSTTAVPQFTKHGTGASSQTVIIDSSIVGFYFSWINATNVSVQGVPAGISAVVDATAKTVTFSGAVTAPVGVYTYTLTTVGGSSDVTRTGVFTVDALSSSSTSSSSSSSVGASSSSSVMAGIQMHDKVLNLSNANGWTRLYNTAGVLKFSARTQTQIDLSLLPRGVYIVKTGQASETTGIIRVP